MGLTLTVKFIYKHRVIILTDKHCHKIITLHIRRLSLQNSQPNLLLQQQTAVRSTLLYPHDDGRSFFRNVRTCLPKCKMLRDTRGVLFYPDDGDCKLLRNVGTYVPNYTASRPRRHEPSHPVRTPYQT